MHKIARYFAILVKNKTLTLTPTQALAITLTLIPDHNLILTIFQSRIYISHSVIPHFGRAPGEQIIIAVLLFSELELTVN